jgi:hypothetical protein
MPVNAQPMPGWSYKFDFDPSEPDANWFFLSVDVTFPKQFRNIRSMFTLTVRDISLDTSRTGSPP